LQAIRPPAVPAVAGGLALAIALLALGSWGLGGALQARLLQGSPHMVPITAVAVAGASLALLSSATGHPAFRRVGAALGALVSLYGALLLVETLTSLEFGIGRALWRSFNLGRAEVMPVITSPATSVAIVLVGLGLATLDVRAPKGPVLSDVAGGLAGALGYVALVAHVTGARELYLESAAGRMALPTAIAFCMLAIGILSARPGRGFASRWTARDSGGVLLRGFLPAALAFPPLLAALRIWGEAQGLFGLEVGIAIMTLGIAALSVPVILMLAQNLSALDAKVKRETDAVRQSEALLRAIVDNTTDAVFLKDRSGRYLLINRFGGAMLGRAPEEIVGHTDDDIFPEEAARVIRFHDLSVLESGEPYTYEEDLQMPAGDRRILLAVKAPYRIDGEVAGLVGISRDITSRKQAERDLKASEARFRALFDAAADGVLVVDAQDRIVLANPQAERMHGWGRHELTGRPMEDLLPPDRRADLKRRRQRDIEAASRGERVEASLEQQDLHRDGSRLDVEIGLTVIKAGDDIVTMVIIRDVTERNRMRNEMARREAEVQAAQEASRLKDAFLSALSHEIKTPLSIVMGYGELLQDAYPGDANVEGMLEGTRRLIRHIQDLLDYAALAAESLPLYTTEACLPEIITDALATVQVDLDRRRQTVNLHLDESVPCIQGDSRRLGQVVRILLDNASRFSPEAATIDLRLVRVGDGVELEVSDVGIGMSLSELQRAFEPFGQARSGDATRTAGLGLGLKIARSLIELHGGQLEILSRPGEGTRARVALPAEASRQAYNVG